MLLTLQDDGVLYVYPSVADLVRDIEALDVEDSVRAAFDENAVPYSICWLEPNRESKGWLGFGSVANGRYTLVPAGDRRPVELLAAIRQAVYVDPVDLEPRVREIEAELIRERQA